VLACVTIGGVVPQNAGFFRTLISRFILERGYDMALAKMCMGCGNLHENRYLSTATHTQAPVATVHTS
jgi:hypothetical protein